MSDNEDAGSGASEAESVAASAGTGSDESEDPTAEVEHCLLVCGMTVANATRFRQCHNLTSMEDFEFIPPDQVYWAVKNV